MEQRDFRRINSDGTPDVGPKILLSYTNYRGETQTRTISPVGLWFGQTEYHPKLGWLLHCYDWDKADWRDYSLADCDFTNGLKFTTTQIGEP